jgi:hypothetical protein
MVTKKELIEVINICEEALRSCGDNYGSESADNGDYEKYYDDKLVAKALKKIEEIK